MKLRFIVKMAMVLIALAFGLTVRGQSTEYATFEGQLKIGKTESVIIYLSEVTDEFWGFCFRNKSAAGRAILAKCENGDECEFTGEVDPRKNCAPQAGVNGKARITLVKAVRRIIRK
jgi:hypothetical protein